MHRHHWKQTGITPEQGNLGSADPTSPIERCIHCGTERVRDRGTKTLYVYRGGKAKIGGGMSVPEGRWTGYTVTPTCVERW